MTEWYYSEAHTTGTATNGRFKTRDLMKHWKYQLLTNYIWLTISLATYAEIVTTCKRYDKAMEQQRVSFVVGEARTVSEKPVMCSYPKCGEKGHSAAHCWIKKKDQKKAQLKQRSKEDPERATEETTTAEISLRTWSLLCVWRRSALRIRVH